MSKSDKPHLNIIIMGHVDNGKSTTTGHLLYLAGVIDQRTIDAYKAEAEKMGKGTFHFAWVLDNLKEERERGVTIDLRFLQFPTKKYNMTVIDAPGHRDFIKNMITGASQADAAILFSSAKKGEFEAGIGPGGQTREHAFLAFTLGIRQLIVGINKMDDSTVNWSKERYEEMKNEISRMLKMVGFKIEKINFIPVSGLKGDNLATKSPNMPWYTGPTMMEAFDQLELPAKPTNKPLRVPVQDVYTITGIGTVPVGRVETGVLKPGTNIVFMPSNKTAEVKSIEMHHTSIPMAEPGDNVGINVRGIAKNDVHRGDVAGSVDNPPTVAKEFIGQIIVIYHPTAIAAGYTPVLHYHTGQIAVKFVELIKKIDPRTGQVSEEHPNFLKTGDAAWVRMEPLHPIAIEAFNDFPELGRFAIRDMGTTVAAGAVKEVTKKGP
ncbi:MAG: translation elongation factor EF-1 subunit alpha [Candidatus Bathyarchaeota archaeon]|uniref:translation elongation factor EF-1 subunit alpha n=1 Tax=Candidatus Bathycorpusculum sp. TaxID=2994959 RepID=UPI0028373E49|nr:translation elongation factor EF-1 subunit alpha [Candidatus Termiticorpusculum sp.]MCL2256666.1 translation elongation factor EF-1 subunit alpha [Candidatus Termiticorpusculum sp.]MCL2292795.1 translation elongation factor EF-1 subunit alpha [Candidatus Termiticorpusculum sp.]